MKTQLLILFGFIGIKSTFAQNDLAIQQWQNAHPTVLFMSYDDFAQLDVALKTTIENKVILFSGELSMENIKKYDNSEKNSDETISTSDKDADLEIIKTWLGLNPHVKIIKQSEFINSSSDLQLIYQNAHALILKGESLTIEDISNY